MALIDVVKYDGNSDVFAWKYPTDDLGTWTQVIVNESQEVILFKGGKALDLFGSGRHTLDTMNIPLLNKIINLPFGGKSPFKAEVWYINKLNKLDIKWGTSSPIQVEDPRYKIFIPIRAFGRFGIKINDSRAFLTKLVGTVSTFNQNEISEYFKGLYLTRVKDAISTYVIKKQISILEINAYLDELSNFIKESMEETFSEYGIGLVNFYVNDINTPEDDSAVIKLKEALAKKAEMDIVGYDYTQERSFDTLEGAAKNTGSGQAGVMGAGIGMGMGFGMGGNIGQQMSGMVNTMNTAPSTKQCPHCNAGVDGNAKFCPQCGKDVTVSESIKKCIKCEIGIAENAKFCHECGTSQTESCPICNKEIRANSKFCPECGNSLVNKCSKCNYELAHDKKFCPECGEKTQGGTNDEE